MSTANIDSADLKGVAYKGLINEDVMQQIWDISKIPLPLTDLAGTESCSNSYKEWVVDKLNAPDLTNARVDGADAGSAMAVTGARVGNQCQQSDKVVKVSYRAQASDTIGRSNELVYRLMRGQQELKRDVEAIALTSQASVADDGNTTAGKSAGLGAWLTTNDFRGAGGSAAGFSNGTVAAAVNGTPRALTEKLVRDCAQAIYEQGGDATVMMSVPQVIRNFSEYLFTSSARVATLTADQGRSATAATALGTVNVFVSDHSTLNLVSNRLQQLEASNTPDSANVYLLDPQYIAFGYLQGYRTDQLAKTGTADNRQILVDWTLMVLNEAAHGVIADIDPTLAVTA